MVGRTPFYERPKSISDFFDPFDAIGMQAQYMSRIPPTQHVFEHAVSRARRAIQKRKPGVQMPYTSEKVDAAVRYFTQQHDDGPSAIQRRPVDADAWEIAFEDLIEENEWCYTRYWEPELVKPEDVMRQGWHVINLEDVCSPSHSYTIPSALC